MTDTVVRSRIDVKVKQEASDVLGKMGLTVSDAIRMMMIRVASEKTLPFEVKVPNEASLQAMAELEAGKGRRARDVASLMADLNADD